MSLFVKMNEETLFFDSMSSQNEVEIQTSDHNGLLSDHNYFSKPRTPKITRITAIYRCKLCGFTTMKRNIIEDHRTTHDKSNQYVPCNSCNVRENPEELHKCPNCDYCTQNEQGLKQHMHFHRQGKAVKCTDCPHYASNIRELIQHNRVNHSKKLQCNLCDFTTGFKTKYNAHVRAHSVSVPRNTSVCLICNFTAKSKSMLNRHLKMHIQNRDGRVNIDR